MTTKPFYQSKTFWFNMIPIVIQILKAFGVDIPIDSDTLIEIMGGGNIVLRAATTKPMTIKKKKTDTKS